MILNVKNCQESLATSVPRNIYYSNQKYFSTLNPKRPFGSHFWWTIREKNSLKRILYIMVRILDPYQRPHSCAKKPCVEGLQCMQCIPLKIQHNVHVIFSCKTEPSFSGMASVSLFLIFANAECSSVQSNLKSTANL